MSGRVGCSVRWEFFVSHFHFNFFFFVSFAVRLCFVEARGTYKKANKFCPILSAKSNIECVVGLDQLDCLRRIHKGAAHFGVFSSEDLIAAEWADVDVLITSEMRFNEGLCFCCTFDRRHHLSMFVSLKLHLFVLRCRSVRI